jgi:sensor histidine kinase regulating citrate/malate metabolism
MTRLFATDHQFDSNVIAGTLLICVINAVYLYLFLALRTRDQVISEDNLIIQRMRAEQQKLTSLQMYDEQLTEWRHDTRKHLRAIMNLAQTSNDIKVIDYVSEIDDSLFKDLVFIDTRNPLFDSLIGNLSKEAVSKGIRVTLDLKVPSLDQINSLDLCSIIGNIWENAIEGCIRSKLPDPEILFTTYYSRNLFVMEIRNSAITDDQDITVSSKAEPGHGLGLKIINRLLEKNNGFYTVDMLPNQFVLKAAFPLPTDDSVGCSFFYWSSEQNVS